MSEASERFDTSAEREQAMSPESRFERMGMAIYGYQLGHMSFLDLIHCLDEMLGLPPLSHSIMRVRQPTSRLQHVRTHMR